MWRNERACAFKKGVDDSLEVSFTDVGVIDKCASVLMHCEMPVAESSRLVDDRFNNSSVDLYLFCHGE